MANGFRFIHAGDFHLHQPLYGVTEVPEHLRDAFLDAPYQAAANVFQAAIDESCDFILLTGDLVNVRKCGPRGPVFLAEQLERLAARSIEVYWAGGAVDNPDDWPAEWLENPILHRFGFDRVEEIVQEKNGEALVCILGVGGNDLRKVRAAEYRTETIAPFTIGMAHGVADLETLTNGSIRIGYWALGGKHERTVLHTTPVVQYSGSPQGRCPSQVGPYGCTMVTVPPDGVVRPQHIATDVVRWHTEKIDLHDEASRDDLYDGLRERIRSLADIGGNRHTLVTWRIATGGRVGARLRSGKLARELTDRLRSEYGHGKPAVWTVGIECEPPAMFGAAHYDEETILGDYLRLARDLEQKPDPIDLSSYLGHRVEAETVASSVAMADPAVRTRVLRQAAFMGIDLLRGDDRDDDREEQS